jgi:hypothetical protein
MNTVKSFIKVENFTIEPFCTITVNALLYPIKDLTGKTTTVFKTPKLKTYSKGKPYSITRRNFFNITYNKNRKILTIKNTMELTLFVRLLVIEYNKRRYFI